MNSRALPIVAALLSLGSTFAMNMSGMVYLHIPKTGSTFGCILLQAACGIKRKCRWETLAPSTKVNKDLINAECPSAFVRFESGHAPMSDELYAPGLKRVMFLRRPWRRSVSGFYNNLHDCSSMRKYVKRGNWSYFYDNITPAHVQEYATCINGCAVRMLTGFWCGGDALSVNLTLALQRLRQFAFVGITDAFEHSVRLFGTLTDTEVSADAMTTFRKGRQPAEWVMRQMAAIPFADDLLYINACENLRYQTRVVMNASTHMDPRALHASRGFLGDMSICDPRQR